ncbi:hypothetical protein SAMN04487752_0230 [Carnobacterium viridans]|uniref:Uncharacterized protein n=1 Tax=Carnobacterium viridans TaxID=174587 RepID=A0A1H0XIP0_9LACT|nr:hypothetical protein SAMN04487752_0230 [Carnobacterium viridans]
MLEVLPFISTVCGFILYNKLEWRGLTNKILFSIFWFFTPIANIIRFIILDHWL